MITIYIIYIYDIYIYIDIDTPSYFLVFTIDLTWPPTCLAIFCHQEAQTELLSEAQEQQVRNAFRMAPRFPVSQRFVGFEVQKQ